MEEGNAAKICPNYVDVSLSTLPLVREEENAVCGLGMPMQVVAPVTRWKPPPVSSHNCHRHTTGERRSWLKFCREGGGGCVNVKGEETRERRKEKRKLGA